LTIDNCFFDLNQLVGMTVEGGNFKFLNSVIKITRTSRVLILQAKTDCEIYKKNWIANNFLMDNCTFKGIN